MLEGLQRHHTQNCGPLDVSFYYSAQASLAHVRNEPVADRNAYRMAIEYVNTRGNAGQTFEYMLPVPLSFFAKVERRDRNGRYLDITEEQISAVHTGNPQKRPFTFDKKGQSFTTRVISYAALTTIAPQSAFGAGFYRVTFDPFPIATLDGAECTAKMPPMEIEVIKGL